MEMIVSSKLLKATDIAEILNISKAMAYQLMKNGKIRTVHIGSARRVRPADLQTYIQENLTPQEN
jgi:excisionase family DNA binding protein